MGTPCAPSYANIFMYMLERTYIEQFKDLILVYMRLIDDIFMILHPNTDTDKIRSVFNSMHPNIKLDFKFSKQEAEFLDLVIYKGPRFHKTGILDLKVHQKQINTYLYIPFTSYHPIFMKQAFIRTELIRYIRNTSDRNEWYKIRNLFFQRLRVRGYSVKFLQQEFQKVSYDDRAHFLSFKTNKNTKETPLVFKATYDFGFQNIELKTILGLHWELIKNDPILRELFPKRPIVSYRKGKTLQQLLVSNKSPPTALEQQ